MKSFFYLIIVLFSISCNEKSPKISTITMIEKEEEQRLAFDGLMRLTDSIIPKESMNDSLSFLILPMEASCPSCRKKVIDSIIAHKNNLKENHYIILSTSTDRRTINAYFIDRKGELPELKGKLFLDTTNYARTLELYENKPTFYYTYDEKAFKKVTSIPTTVKDDLQEFFSGHHKSKI